MEPPPPGSVAMEPPSPGAWSNLELEQWAVSAVGVYNAHVEDYNAHVQEYNALAREHSTMGDRLASLEYSQIWTAQRVSHLDSKVTQYSQMFGPAHLALVAGEVWNWAAEQQYWAAETPDPNDTPVAGKFSRINDPQKLYEIQNCAARLRYGNGACTFDQLVRVADLCIDTRNRRHHFRTAAHLADAVGSARQFLQSHPDIHFDPSLQDAIWTLHNFQIIREEFGF